MKNHPKYKFYKELHPDWSDDQIKTAISIDMSAENEVNRRGKDINPDDPDLIRDILEGARTWLAEVLPQVFERVRSFFDNIISTLTTWVQNGLKYVVDLIGKILGKDLN